MKRKIQFALVCLLLSSCAMRGPISEQKISKISKISIVSALGSNFHNTAIGTTVFTNDKFMQKVEGWKIDEYAAREAEKLLSASSSKTVRVLQVPGLEEVANDESYIPDTSILIEKASEYSQKNGFDTALIIRKARSDNYPHFNPGYGFYERSFFGSSKRCIYAMYIVSVVDTQTQKTIGWEWGGASPCDLGSDDDMTIKKSFSEYSVEEKLQLKRRLKKSLTTSISYAITSMKLLN